MSKTSTNKTLPFFHCFLSIFLSSSFSHLLLSLLFLCFFLFPYSYLFYFPSLIIYSFSLLFFFSSSFSSYLSSYSLLLISLYYLFLCSSCFFTSSFFIKVTNMLYNSNIFVLFSIIIFNILTTSSSFISLIIFFKFN